jgi:hypothetical protein
MDDGAPPEAAPCWVANRDATHEFGGDDHDDINDADDRSGAWRFADASDSPA